MIRFKSSHVMLALGLIAPICSNAADYCIAVNNGFGHGGTSFIGKGFTCPLPESAGRGLAFSRRLPASLRSQPEQAADPPMARLWNSPS
jgi:hypothetical protein